MRIRFLAVALAPVLLAAVGCSKDNADVTAGSNPEGVTVAALDGKTFVSTDVTGHTLVPGSQVTVSFQGGAVRANAGCNSIGGDYTISNSILNGGDTFSSTLMGCDGDLAAQDDWLGAFLGAAPNLTLSGDVLTMTARGSTITLTDNAAASVAWPLVGTTWTLDTIVAGAAASSVPAGVETPTLLLGADGQAALSTGCNTGGAGYSTNGPTLSFGPVRLTKMACPQGSESVEAAVVAVLDGDVTFAIDGAQLTLTKDDHGLIYRAP